MLTRILLLTFASLVSFSNHAYSSSKTEIWKSTSLDVKLFKENIISPEICTQHPRLFIGCVFALEEAFSLATDGKYTIISKQQLAAYPKEYGKIAAEIGELVVASSTFKPSGAIHEVYREVKNKFARDLRVKEVIFMRTPEIYDFEKAIDWLATEYLTSDNEAAVIGQAISHFMKTIRDPHTYIMPAQYFAEAIQNNGNSIIGIGAQLNPVPPYIVVHSVVEGGPADLAGLRTKDLIVAVDGKKMTDLPPQQMLHSISGPANTDVTLTIKRGRQVSDITVTRNHVQFDNVTSQLLSHASGDIGYIKLRSFTPTSSCDKVKEAVKKLSTLGAKGLILDLRDNGGGQLSQAVCITNIFIGKNKVVVSEQDINTNKTLSTKKTTEPQFTKLPTTVLINPRSASASEIVAGALKDHERAILVGETSYGKGTVQRVAPWALAKDVLIAQTTSRFHLPNGWSNQKVGVTPDLEVFTVPNPTEKDKFAVRESDEFLPIWESTTSFRYSKTFELTLKKLNDCISQSGTAVEEFTREVNEYYTPDFQILKAQDALSCMNNTAETNS